MKHLYPALFLSLLAHVGACKPMKQHETSKAAMGLNQQISQVNAADFPYQPNQSYGADDVHRDLIAQGYQASFAAKLEKQDKEAALTYAELLQAQPSELYITYYVKAPTAESSLGLVKKGQSGAPGRATKRAKSSQPPAVTQAALATVSLERLSHASDTLARIVAAGIGAETRRRFVSYAEAAGYTSTEVTVSGAMVAGLAAEGTMMAYRVCKAAICAVGSRLLTQEPQSE